MKTKFIFISIILFCSILNVEAQSLKIIDLSVMPLVQANGISDPDSTEIMVSFKINDVSQAKNLHIDFGTNHYANDILALQATFSGNNIIMNGISSPVTNYQAGLNIKLSNQQYNSMHNLTLYVTDNSGIETGKLEFVK